MRVLSWNVRSLRDGRRGVVAVLRSCAADVVVLQEAPRLLGWRLSRWWLARRSGLRLATTGWACGNAVLVRPGVEVLEQHEVRAPRRPGLHRRGAAVAVLRVAGAEGTEALELVVVGTHLDLDPEARVATARVVRAEAARSGAPVVIAGDVNDLAGSPAWQALASGLVDAGPEQPTFPARSPSRRIDALLVDPRLAVLRSEVVALSPPLASDHLPLHADLGPRTAPHPQHP